MDREVPPPLLLADKHTRAGAYLQKAGGLPAGAGGRPPGLVVRYAACGGLFNQHYCHVTAIAMAIALGAEGVVSLKRTPPSLPPWHPGMTVSPFPGCYRQMVRDEGVTVLLVCVERLCLCNLARGCQVRVCFMGSGDAAGAAAEQVRHGRAQRLVAPGARQQRVGPAPPARLRSQCVRQTLCAWHAVRSCTAVSRQSRCYTRRWWKQTIAALHLYAAGR